MIFVKLLGLIALFALGCHGKSTDECGCKCSCAPKIRVKMAEPVPLALSPSPAGITTTPYYTTASVSTATTSAEFECPEPYIGLLESCYFHVSDVADKTTQEGVCAGMSGGQLVLFETVEELIEVESFYVLNSVTGSSFFIQGVWATTEWQDDAGNTLFDGFHGTLVAGGNPVFVGTSSTDGDCPHLDIGTGASIVASGCADFGDLPAICEMDPKLI